MYIRNMTGGKNMEKEMLTSANLADIKNLITVLMQENENLNQIICYLYQSSHGDPDVFGVENMVNTVYERLLSLDDSLREMGNCSVELKKYFK